MQRWKGYALLNILLGVSMHVGELTALQYTGQDLYYGDTSESFIIRWGFQNYCDHVFDPRTITWPTTREKGGVRFDPKDVKLGDTVFVRDMPTYMKELHPFIDSPYILITHGEHFETTYEHELDYLDDPKIIAWFAIHPCKGNHPKYHPLPLGIKQENEYFDNRSSVNDYFKELRAIPKTKNVYVNFATKKNEERRRLKEQIENASYAVIPEKPVPFMEYMKEMADCRFALSPRGFGPDCYRTWEALLVGTIPIVRRNQYGRMKDGFPIKEPLNHKNCEVWYEEYSSQLDKLYEDLPILVIDDWDELTEEFLEYKYQEITSRKYNIDKLYEEFWFRQIKDVKKKFVSKISYWQWLKQKTNDVFNACDISYLFKAS